MRALLLLLSSLASAASIINIPLLKRNNLSRDLASIIVAADHLRYKYGYPPANPPSSRKRAGSANVQLMNQNQDSSYIAPISIGTPAQKMNVVLDTGSADLWVATDQCIGCNTGAPIFQTSKSSSLQYSSNTVQIPYGTGQVSGNLAKDIVTIANFTIQGQIFVAAYDISQVFIHENVTGILGLAFEPLAVTQATPFWQALIQNNQLSAPELSFYMTRLVNVSNAPTEAPGGMFTLGGTDSSLYTGNIEYLDVIGSPPSFWFLSISQVTVEGKPISITKGDSAIAAIDTGTNLIGGPSADVAAIYSAIPGSQPVLGAPGLYSFPCSIQVAVTISFGGKSWPISSADMIVAQASQTLNQCVGGIFDLPAASNIQPGPGNPGWVVGNTFLKNVYSVFRSSPPSIGFAKLSAQASADLSSSSGVIPPTASVTPTSLRSPSGGVPATVTVTAATPGASTGISSNSPAQALNGKAVIVTLLTSLISISVI